LHRNDVAGFEIHAWFVVLPVKSNHCASKLPTPTYHEQFAEFDTI